MSPDQPSADAWGHPAATGKSNRGDKLNSKSGDNLGNYLRQLVLPREIKRWTLTTTREKLIKIGAKVVRHARRVAFQLAEVAVPRRLFLAILCAINRLRLPMPAPG